MVRTSQGGSVLGFIVVGVALASLLIGGVYFVRQNTTLMASSVAQPEEAKPDVAREEPKPSTEGDKPKEEKKPSVQPEKTEQKPDTKVEKPKEAEKPVPRENTATDDKIAEHKELPQTGPIDTLVSLIGAGTLVGVLVAYFQSRRLRASL